MLPPGSEPRTEAEREAQAARARCRTEAGIWAYKRRMADAEGVISELKLQHGLGRARCRGIPLFHIQLLLGCAAINLKRLAKHVPEAGSGAGAAPAAEADAVTTASRAHEEPGSIGSATPPLRLAMPWALALCLN
jgi:hypothetical protein